MAGKDRKSLITAQGLLCICAAFISILLLSCQSAPKVVDAMLERTGFLPLDGGASLYVMADAKQMRPVLERLPIEELKDGQTKQMLDRTGYLAAALFPKESGRRFQLAAWGSYPGSQAGLALTAARGWEKRRSGSGGSYWYSRSNRLSLAVGSRQAFAAASLTDEPFDPLSAAGVEMPEGFAAFRKDADGISSPFSCWLETPNMAVSRIMNDLGVPMRFPVQKLFISLLPAREGKHEAAIRLRFENASHARAMTAVLNLASGLFPKDSGLTLASVLFANPAVLNGNNVDIKSAALTPDEVANLLGIFLFI
jgi:hypothetical protein